jgi:glycosyltransferase involved in cell wall biosynthesis
MNSKRKTLCIFTPAFPKDEADSIWVPWLQIFVKALNETYPVLKIIIFSFQYPTTTTEYKWQNNMVVPFNIREKKKFVRLITWLKILRKVQKLKRENNITGIFSLWCGETTFLAKWCKKLFGIKYHCWILGGDARKGNKYVKRIQPEPSELIAMSDFLAEEFFTNYHIRPKYVITNGIDTSLFRDIPQIKDIDMIGVGALNALKQYTLFVEVVAEIKKKYPSVKAMLCGDGEERKNIENLIEQLSLTKNIRLTGMLSYVEGLKMMQRAKILLHPSSYEGFSTVCLEALYAGAHVISFIKPMHHEIKNWHIVKTKEEMFQKALQLLSFEDVAYESVLVYSMEDSVHAIMQLFTSSTKVQKVEVSDTTGDE